MVQVNIRWRRPIPVSELGSLTQICAEKHKTDMCWISVLENHQ